MSERCERCKKGYAGAPPRDDIDWPLGRPEPWRAAVRELKFARCTRCSSWLFDLWTTDPERTGSETHEICVVSHGGARAAALEHDATALAAISPQVRRRHLELLVAALPSTAPATLEAIESGNLPATEALRGLVTRLRAVGQEWPAIGDVRPRGSPVRGGASAVGTRVPLDLGDGSRVMLEVLRERLTLTRMRGDAVTWRREIPAAGRDGFVTRVRGRAESDLAVLAANAPGEGGAALCLVSSDDGTLQGPGRVDLRVAVFEASALPRGGTFIASYQGCAVVRSDASVAWRGSAAGFPVAVPLEDGVVLTDAPWRLVAITLPEGHERWSIPIDRSAVIAPAGEGHLLLTTSDVVSRVEVRGDGPRLVWMATGASPLPLSNGGAAVVRERWERSARVIECVVIDPDGKRRFAVARPEATKVPISEIGPGALLFHAGGDVAVTVGDRITYVLALPDRRTAQVTLESGGAWIEYEGIVDRVDESGRRTGRWRIG